MNPDTNRFERLSPAEVVAKATMKTIENYACLLRPNGEPVPSHWTQFCLDELVEIKGYTFRVKYIGETSILFEPVGPIVVKKENS